MQIYSDWIMIFLHRFNGFAQFWCILFCKIEFLELWLKFLIVWKKLSTKLSKSEILAFFQISTKLSISVEDFLKLSAIWRNYRQNFLYRKWQENLQNFCVIKKPYTIQIGGNFSLDFFQDFFQVFLFAFSSGLGMKRGVFNH